MFIYRFDMYRNFGIALYLQTLNYYIDIYMVVNVINSIDSFDY